MNPEQTSSPASDSASAPQRPSACPRCGHGVAANAPQGLCPPCLYEMALATEPRATSASAGAPPGPEEIAAVAAAFPQFSALEYIGGGGMGQVYKVRQTHLDRVVAMKILPRELAVDAAFAERFVREGKALAKLTHPNIVSIFDFGESQGYFYLLMEYVDGVNLRQAMRSGLTPGETLSIIPKVCAALQYAHEQGVLHRDIKPENILIDTHGQVKIADFGVAKMGGAQGRPNLTLTASGATVGTPHYMAPEQIENAQGVDHRADIYSLGVVFYELLTGGLPLGRFPAPSEKSGSDPRLDGVVFRALEKEREKRYQSAGDVRAEVETVVRTPRAQPPPMPLATPKVPAHLKGTGKLSHKAVWSLVLVLLPALLAPLLILGVWTRRSSPPNGVVSASIQSESMALVSRGINPAAITKLQLATFRVEEPFPSNTTLGGAAEKLRAVAAQHRSAPLPSPEIRFDLLGGNPDMIVPPSDFKSGTLLEAVEDLCARVGLNYHVDAGVVEIGPEAGVLFSRNFQRLPSMATINAADATAYLKHLGIDFSAPGSGASWSGPGAMTAKNTVHQLRLVDEWLGGLPLELRNSPGPQVHINETEERGAAKRLESLLGDANKLSAQQEELLKGQKGTPEAAEVAAQKLSVIRQRKAEIQSELNQPQYLQLLTPLQGRGQQRAFPQTGSTQMTMGAPILGLFGLLLVLGSGLALGIMALGDIRRSGGLMRGALRAACGAGFLPGAAILAAGPFLVSLSIDGRLGANRLYILSLIGCAFLVFLMVRAFYRSATCWEAPVDAASPGGKATQGKLALWLAIAGSVCAALLIITANRLRITDDIRFEQHSIYLQIASTCLLLAGVVVGFLAGSERSAKAARWLGSLMLVVVLLTLS